MARKGSGCRVFPESSREEASGQPLVAALSVQPPDHPNILRSSTQPKVSLNKQ